MPDALAHRPAVRLRSTVPGNAQKGLDTAVPDVDAGSPPMIPSSRAAPAPVTSPGDRACAHPVGPGRSVVPSSPSPPAAPVPSSPPRPPPRRPAACRCRPSTPRPRPPRAGRRPRPGQALRARAAAARADRHAARPRHPDPLHDDGLPRRPGRGERGVRRADGALGRARTAPARRRRPRDDGPGRPVLGVPRPRARPRRRHLDALRRLREPRDVQAARDGHGRRRHRLRRARDDGPHPHVRQPGRRRARRARRGPCGAHAAGHEPDGAVAARPLRLQPGRRRGGAAAELAATYAPSSRCGPRTPVRRRPTSRRPLPRSTGRSSRGRSAGRSTASSRPTRRWSRCSTGTSRRKAVRPRRPVDDVRRDAILAYANATSDGWTTNGRRLSQIIAAEPQLTAFVGASSSARAGPRAPSGSPRASTTTSSRTASPPARGLLVPARRRRHVRTGRRDRNAQPPAQPPDAAAHGPGRRRHVARPPAVGGPATSNCGLVPFLP